MKRCASQFARYHSLSLWVLVPWMLLLGSCTAYPSPCSCSRMSDKPEPTWVGKDSLSDDFYHSQGIGECTGIQSLDFEEADKKARTNLSRMLKTRIESEVKMTETVSGGTSRRGPGHTTGQVTSRQSTENLLEYSTIYDHWIDPNACTVHSAVKISRQDVDKVKNDQQ